MHNYMHTGLLSGTDHSVYIIANGPGGEVSPAGNVATFRTLEGTVSVRREAEDIYRTVTDVGSYPVVVDEAPLLSNGEGVTLYDKGDVIELPFDIAVSGTYEVTVGLRSGENGSATSFYSNRYSFMLDGGVLSLTGDAGAVSPYDPDNFGGAYYGSMKSAPIALTNGPHILKVTAEAFWCVVDYLEVSPADNSGNQSPVADAGGDVTVLLPRSNYTLSGSGSDSDGEVVSYIWTQRTGPMLTMKGTDGPDLRLEDLLPGVYVFRLTVTDDKGDSGYDEVTVTIEGQDGQLAVNSLTLINAVTDLPIEGYSVLAPGSIINLNALPTRQLSVRANVTGPVQSVAFQLTGPIRYEKIESLAPYALFGDVDGDYNAWSPEGGLLGNHIIRAVPYDGSNGAGTVGTPLEVDLSFVEGTGGNTRPVADAGADQSLIVPQGNIVLDGGNSSDAESGLSYRWQQTSGESVTLSGKGTSRLSISGLIAGSYDFRLTVTDAEGLSDSDDVVVQVAPSPGGNVVLGLTLIDATTDLPIAGHDPIQEGAVIRLGELGTDQLNIRADTDPGTVGSVVFSLSGSQTYSKTESAAPYALFGDNSGDYNVWTPVPVTGDTYTLVATPYDQSGGNGNAGTTRTVTFSISEGTQPGQERYQAEDHFTVVSEAGTKGNVSVLESGILDGGRGVRIYDPGDALAIPFDLSASGDYRLRVRVRSGDATSGDAYWPDAYTFTLDGSPLVMTGDATTIVTTSQMGGAGMGVMQSGTLTLTNGGHSLEVAATESWQVVDYLEIVGEGTLLVPPTGPVATGTTATGTSLSWTASTSGDISGYHVYRDGTKVNGPVVQGTTYQVDGLSPNSSYTFTIRTVDKDGNLSTESVGVPVTTGSGVADQRIEIEGAFTVLADVGSKATVSAGLSSSILGGSDGVRLFDPGDRLGVDFTVDATGDYVLKVHLRSGSSLYNDNYWPGGYAFTLDGGAVTFTGDAATPAYTSDLGGAWFGTMETAPTNLTAGVHTLTIEGVTDWALVDYLEVIDPSNGGGGSNRTTEGLLVQYDLTEGGGNIVYDGSGVGSSLDLDITGTGGYTWLSGGGIDITSEVLLSSSGAAAKVITAAKASDALTIEAWVAPANTTQSGPARIVGVSGDSGNRNFTLAQDGNRYTVRRRTTGTNNNGLSGIFTPTGSVTTGLTHVVYTHGGGVERIYLDGVEEVVSSKANDYSGWNDGYQLAIAGEIGSSGSRFWLGEMYTIAVYDRALSQEEVTRNFSAGPNGTGGSGGGTVTIDPPTALSASNITTGSVDLSWTASTSGNISGYHVYRDGVKVTASEVTGTTYTVTGLSPGTTYDFHVTALDQDGNESVASGNQQVTTSAPAPQTIEIEGNFTTLVDTGSKGTVGDISSSSFSNGQGVRVFDLGDKLRVDFSVPVAGDYIIKVRVRSGNSSNATAYWPDDYGFELDGTAITLTGDTGSTTYISSFGGGYLGTMESAATTLSSGSHNITIEALSNWQYLDYIEIVFSN